MHMKHNYIFYGSMAYIIHTGVEFGTLPVYMQVWDFYVNRLDEARVGLSHEKSFIYLFASLIYWSRSRAFGREDHARALACIARLRYRATDLLENNLYILTVVTMMCDVVGMVNGIRSFLYIYFIIVQS